jgi:hypothetical protein
VRKKWVDLLADSEVLVGAVQSDVIRLVTSPSHQRADGNETLSAFRQIRELLAEIMQCADVS